MATAGDTRNTKGDSKGDAKGDSRGHQWGRQGPWGHQGHNGDSRTAQGDRRGDSRGENRGAKASQQGTLSGVASSNSVLMFHIVLISSLNVLYAYNSV